MSKQFFVQAQVRGVVSEAAAYGVRRLSEARSQEALSVICAYTGTPEGTELAKRGVPVPEGAESFAIKPLASGETGVLASDENGLMYACFEITEALKISGGALDGVVPVSKAPFVKNRGLFKFLHNADCERSWFYSKEYWIRTFDTMAEDRYNSYNLVFSHQTSYLAPMFAYFVDIPEFPGVRAAGATAQDIRENADMLRFISRQAAARGIKFIIGIWQVRAWTGGGKDWKHTQPTRVTGLHDENIEAYTYAGMKKLIAEFPDIAGLQIRANEESGIVKTKQSAFYHNTLFRAMREADRPFVFDLRCWATEKETYADALTYPGTRLSCKYWSEFMGAPYQPAKTIPGYSYADMLKQPLERDFSWQVWTLGSPRLLLWGDPEYARRFILSTRLGGANGFEINLPLAQKGYGNEPGAWRIFKDPGEEYFEFEDERYWFFQSLFGRYGYDPDLGEAAYMPALKERFGELAERVRELYARGSDIITFLTHISLSDPNMYVWPEIDTGGALDYYIQTLTPDQCVVKNITAQVEEEMSGKPSGRFTPLDAAARFEEMAEATLRVIARLEREPADSKELRSTITDFKTLSYLALYHARKKRAALSLARWYEVSDTALLRDCLAHIQDATGAWEKLIECTQDHYHDHMVTGPTDAGCWKTKLPLVYEDELRVAQLLRLYEQYPPFGKAFDFGAPYKRSEPRVRANFTLIHRYAIERGYTEATEESVYSAVSGFGFESGSPVSIGMPPARLTDHHFDPLARDTMTAYPVEKMKGYRAPLFEDALTGEGPAVFRVDMPAGKYEATLIVCDKTPQARVRGPFSVRMGGTAFEDVEVMPLQEKRLTAEVDAADGAIRVFLDDEWFISGLILRPKAPLIKTYPRAVLAAGEEISATVYSPSGIASCALVLKADGRERRTEMKEIRPNEFAARLPGDLDAAGFYSVEARGRDGGTAVGADIPFRARTAPSRISMTHTPVTEAAAGADCPLRLGVDSALPVAGVRLFYTSANHMMPVESADMTFDGDAWSACIPGGALSAEWLTLYWFEAVDICAGGAMSPDFRKQTPYHIIKVLGAV